MLEWKLLRIFPVRHGNDLSYKISFALFPLLPFILLLPFHPTQIDGWDCTRQRQRPCWSLFQHSYHNQRTKANTAGLQLSPLQRSNKWTLVYRIKQALPCLTLRGRPFCVWTALSWRKWRNLHLRGSKSHGHWIFLLVMGSASSLPPQSMWQGDLCRWRKVALMEEWGHVLNCLIVSKPEKPKNLKHLRWQGLKECHLRSPSLVSLAICHLSFAFLEALGVSLWSHQP